MKLILIFSAVVVTALTGVSAAKFPRPDPVPVDGKIEWIFDYADGQRQALKSGKPMFVVFRCER